MRADNNGEGGILALTGARARSAARDRRRRARRLLVRSASSAPRSSSATASSRRRSRCSARSRAWRSRRRGSQPVRRADHARHPGRPVRGPAPRHRRRRHAVRPGDGGLVRDASAVLGHRADRATTRRSCGAVDPHYARALLRRRTAVRSASSCSARWCSPSPAPRRSTPTWATSASGRSASPGSARDAGAAAQLLRPGRAAARRPERGRATRSTCWRRAWALYPLVVLATCATVIASQALISGAFSLTQQAIQLGYCPRLDDPAHVERGDRPDLRARSSTGRCCVGVVVARRRLRSSSDARRRLRHRGDGDMVITTMLLLRRRATRWKWPRGWRCARGRLSS